MDPSFRPLPPPSSPITSITPITLIAPSEQESGEASVPLINQVAGKVHSMSERERAQVSSTPGARGVHGVAKKLVLAQAKREAAEALVVQARELERSAGAQASAIEAGTPDRPLCVRQATIEDGAAKLPKTIDEAVPMLRAAMSGNDSEVGLLFGVGRGELVVRKDGTQKLIREYLNGVRIGRIQDIDGNECNLLYTGEELTQAELDVWLAVLDLCRQAGGSMVEVSATALLKHLGRSDGTKNYASLKDQLRKLNAAAFSVEGGGREKSCRPRLLEYEIPRSVEGTRREPLRIWLDPRLVKLYGEGSWASVDIRLRRNLKSNTARWLQVWISASSSPHPIKVDTLQARARDDSEPRKWRARLSAAVEELVGVGLLHPGSGIEQGENGIWMLTVQRRIRQK